MNFVSEKLIKKASPFSPREKKFKRWDPHGFKRRILRMTPQCQMRSSRPRKSEGSGWRIIGTLPAVKRHPSKEWNCWIHSPIEGGFRGVCLYLFCLFTFYQFLYFQDRNLYLNSIFDGFLFCGSIEVYRMRKQKWRREWDSNPHSLAAYRFSRPAPCQFGHPSAQTADDIIPVL